MVIIFSQNRHRSLTPIIALRLLFSEFLFTSLQLTNIALNCSEVFKVDHKSILTHSTHNLIYGVTAVGSDNSVGRTGAHPSEALSPFHPGFLSVKGLVPTFRGMLERKQSK